MKVEQISVNFLTHTLVHNFTSEAKKIELNKKSMVQDVLKYLEDYCTRNEFELLPPMIEGSFYIYHLVKK
jgi:hypothetical protein